MADTTSEALSRKVSKPQPSMNLRLAQKRNKLAPLTITKDATAIAKMDNGPSLPLKTTDTSDPKKNLLLMDLPTGMQIVDLTKREQRLMTTLQKFWV